MNASMSITNIEPQKRRRKTKEYYRDIAIYYYRLPYHDPLNLPSYMKDEESFIKYVRKHNRQVNCNINKLLECIN